MCTLGSSGVIAPSFTARLRCWRSSWAIGLLTPSLRAVRITAPLALAWAAWQSLSFIILNSGPEFASSEDGFSDMWSKAGL